MVSGNELYAASEIFGMLQEKSDDGNTSQPSSGSCSVGGGGGGGEPQCDINGYCKGDTAWDFQH